MIDVSSSLNSFKAFIRKLKADLEAFSFNKEVATVTEGQQEVPPSKSTLKFYVNDKDVWVCSTTAGQRVCGTITERTSPSLYKVNNQTWRRLVKKLQDSYLAPPRKETNDCFVPEIGKHVMPVVPETEQKEAPNSVLKSQPKPSPESNFSARILDTLNCIFSHQKDKKNSCRTQNTYPPPPLQMAQTLSIFARNSLNLTNPEFQIEKEIQEA
ncbi:hypothetical protein pdam_00008534 [Pocillopora damicornis]|uniref:Uncharacterized protein n=1 Tax=Pocillopora damicornis TaxID=46731 RepID=A0A3M6U275_POCDA|nr:hypothetical protein pdam_00008534 [Pocillopora damicornis]